MWIKGEGLPKLSTIHPFLFAIFPIILLYSQNFHLLPIEISIREKIGHVVSTNNLEKIPEIIKNLENENLISEQIRKIRSETVYNIGNSAKIGAEIIEKIYRK